MYPGSVVIFDMVAVQSLGIRPVQHSTAVLDDLKKSTSTSREIVLLSFYELAKEADVVQGVQSEGKRNLSMYCIYGPGIRELPVLDLLQDSCRASKNGREKKTGKQGSDDIFELVRSPKL